MVTLNNNEQCVLDIGLLRKAVDWVEHEAAKPAPEREWNQGLWHETVNLRNRCGTTFCVAGYIADISGGEWTGPDSSYLVATPEELAAGVADDDNEVHASERAARLLGLNHYKAMDMFQGHNSAAEVRRMAVQFAREAGEEL